MHEHYPTSSADFLACCRGEISGKEYVRRLQERGARRRARNSDPITLRDGSVVWVPKSKRRDR